MFKMPVLYNNTKRMLSMFGGRCVCNIVSNVTASFVPGGPIVSKVLSLAVGNLAASIVPFVISIAPSIFSNHQAKDEMHNQNETTYQKVLSSLRKVGYEKILPAIVGIGINKLVIDKIVPAGVFKLNFENLPSISLDEVKKLISVTAKDLINNDISQKIVQSTSNAISSVRPS